MERNIKELLIYLRDHISKYGLGYLNVWDFGLCEVIDSLFLKDYILITEHVLLRSYLSRHAPKKKNGEYWFPPRKKEPRIKWLNKQIEKL